MNVTEDEMLAMRALAIEEGRIVTTTDEACRVVAALNLPEHVRHFDVRFVAVDPPDTSKLAFRLPKAQEPPPRVKAADSQSAALVRDAAPHLSEAARQRLLDATERALSQELPDDLLLLARQMGAEVKPVPQGYAATFKHTGFSMTCDTISELHVTLLQMALADAERAKAGTQ